MAVVRTQKREPLTGSTDGRPIHITGTSAGTANTITVVPKTNEGTFAAVNLIANNGQGSAHDITILYGGTSASDALTYSVASKSKYQVLEDDFLQGGLTIKAYASSPNVLAVYGWIDIVSRE